MRPADPLTRVATVDGHAVEYRWYRTGGPLLLVFPGAFMSVRSYVAQDMFLEAGWSVLVVTRPGYGNTAVEAGRTHTAFVDRVAALCRQLDVRPEAVAGLSLGARPALTMAAAHPDMVQRVILLGPTSFEPWPTPWQRLVATVAFNPVLERPVWAVLHYRIRRGPRGLRLPVGTLSTLRAAEAVERLGEDRRAAAEFLLTCRARRGFLLDLGPTTDVTAAVVQPTLVVGTRNDGAVDFHHAAHLGRTLPRGRLVEVDAGSHLVWFGDAAAGTRAAVREALA